MICAAYDLRDCATPHPEPHELLDAMRAAVRRLGATILGELPVLFQPHGITCVLVLAESHLIVSTWPEHQLAHIDLFTCRADTDPEHALQPIIERLGSRTVHGQRIQRAMPAGGTWPASRCATSSNTPPTRPCWSASATPNRSTPPSPAWATRSARTRSPRSLLYSIHQPTKGHPIVQYIEVEKKFALPDPAALKAKLDELGAKPGEPTRQVDAYYNAPHRDFLAPEAISEWLRIRTEDRGSSVNYKRWHPVDALIKTHADEYETKIEDVEAIRLLLQALDFTPLVTVDKTREEWNLPEIEIVFDHVVDAGDFVEFEFKGDAENTDDATTRLEEFIASLDVQLGEPINRGYPHILLGREH